MSDWFHRFLLLLLVAPSVAGARTELSEDRFSVQQKATTSWIYTVGAEGLSTGAFVRLQDPVFHGMRWSKWGDLSPWWDDCTPQTTAQFASWGLVTAHAMREGKRFDGVELEVRRTNCEGPLGACRADVHEAASTVVELIDGALDADDELVVVVGDEEGCRTACAESGSSDCSVCDHCGFEMPDRAFPQIDWSAELCGGGGECTGLAPVTLSVSSLPTVSMVLVTAPSQVVVGTPLRLKVALLDPWGNPVPQANKTLRVALDGQTHTLAPDDDGWHDFIVQLEVAGVHRLEVEADEMSGTSNPIEVVVGPITERVLWGDIHTHHGYTWMDPEGRVRDLNHDYGRDVMGLDVVAETQKAQGIEIDEDALWTELQENCAGYSEDGEYIVLLGFEWMGTIASDAFGTPSQGHHNVYYDGCDAPLGTHSVEVIADVDGEQGLWSWLSQVTASTGTRSVTVPHAMRWTGFDYTVRNPGVQTLAEIYSEWGDNTEWLAGQTDADQPGSVQDLLNSGLRLGWIGGSDNHDGWLGNPYSTKNVRSGLAAFVVEDHTRAGVFGAMQSRRTFATTGHRPLLRFWAKDDVARVDQGTEYLAVDPVLAWSYEGTADVDLVTIWQVAVEEGALQERVERIEGSTLTHSGELPLSWDGTTPVAVWLMVEQVDGERAWSSPIWLANDCERRAEGAQDPLGLCTAVDTAAPSTDTGPVRTQDGTPHPIPKNTRCSCAASGAPVRVLVWLWAGLFVFSRRSGPRRSATDQR